VTPGAHRLGGLRRIGLVPFRRGRRGTAPERRGQQEHDAVERGREPDRAREAQIGQQHERGEQRAADRARGVHRVEQADAPADLRFFGDRVARQHRQRRAHERGGQCESEKCAAEIEKSGARVVARRRARLAAEHRLQSGVGQPQEQRHRENRAHRDAELEQRVRQHRASHARQEALREHRAERKAAHVRGEDRGDGELRRAEHDRELARPRGLVDESRDATQDEAGAEE
jgi:hypothetical protein